MNTRPPRQSPTHLQVGIVGVIVGIVVGIIGELVGIIVGIIIL